MLKKNFELFDRINDEYVKKAFNFAYSMSFGKEGEHRSYRSGGTARRKNGTIFANTFQGKLCEFALYQTLKDTHDINEPDLEVYGLGKWDAYDFKINDKVVSVKSTKSFGQLLLLETKDWTENGEYIPNDNEHYDLIIMIRLQNQIETIMKVNRLYYSDKCEKSKLEAIIDAEPIWYFDRPVYITNKELQFLIKEKYIIKKGDLLNNGTRMDASNYYCHIAEMHDIMELK